MEVWLHHLPGDVAFPREYLEVLDDAEKKRAREYRRDDDRRRFVASRAVLRTALSRATHRPPHSFQFALAESGEWRLREAAPDIHFSLSHTDTAIAVATSGRRVGIDIETLRTHVLEHSVGGVFSEREQRALRKLSESQRPRHVLRLWTAKEAFAKWMGRGAELEFADLEVDFSPPRFVRYGEREMGAKLEWFEAEREGQAHQVALAYARSSDERMELRSIETSELIQEVRRA